MPTTRKSSALRLVSGSCLVLVFEACSSGAGQAPTAVPTSAPTAAATATRAPVSATATPAPQPTATPEPAASPDTVWVGNTDGEGVYLRNTPAMADRLQAYPDGTPLTIIGDDVEGDDQSWHHVRAPDGTEGYVPSVYTVDTQP